MYNTEYANKWIEFEEAGQDVFRDQHILPYFSEVLGRLEPHSEVLDIGCGWGAALAFVPEACKYTGIDPTKRFFDYILGKHPHRNIRLITGELPDLPIDEDSFDLVLCSMVLHCTRYLEESIDALFDACDGKVVIVDFNDEAEKHARPRFKIVDENRPDYIRGLYNLSDTIELY
ncbi:methyltransferase domain-containing protein, partial [Candidatus Woesearchaeota archaeon]|nr:methyltransferase domain-containing protein [Candidatus Woesearchaeota archaeon]